MQMQMIKQYQTIGMKRKDELLGSIVRNMYSFIESNYNPGMGMYDDVSGKEKLARDYFRETRGRYVIERENLPFDVDIKGAYINKRKNQPIVESSALNFPELEELLKTNNAGELKGRSIFSNYDEKVIQTITGLRDVNGEKSLRSNIIFLPKATDYEAVDSAVYIADLIYENSLFKEDPRIQDKIDSVSEPSKSPRIELKQKLELAQIIEGEQIITVMPQLNPYQKMIAEVMTMPRHELEQKLEEMGTMLAPILTQACIRKIKAAAPNLSWKQARKMYYRLMKKDLD